LCQNSQPLCFHGNLRCKCAKGKKHQQYYFSVNVDKKTKLMYLGKAKKAEAEKYVLNFDLLRSKK